jgi:hypothetical protein
MKETHLEREKALSEGQIQDKASDFSARYFAVYHLQCLAQTHPEIITSKTISTVQGLLKDPGFSRQRRGFFLCRLAADTGRYHPPFRQAIPGRPGTRLAQRRPCYNRWSCSQSQCRGLGEPALLDLRSATEGGDDTAYTECELVGYIG